MALFGSNWCEDMNGGYSDWSSYKDISTDSKNITKEDILNYIKQHPEIMDDVTKLIRKEKLKKLNNINVQSW